MASTERSQQLAREYYGERGLVPETRKETRGRPTLAPPPPEPRCPPIPAPPQPQADSLEPGERICLGTGLPYTKGELRGLVWMDEVAAIYRDWNNLHWEWKQRLGLTAKRHK